MTNCRSDGHAAPEERKAVEARLRAIAAREKSEGPCCANCQWWQLHAHDRGIDTRCPVHNRETGEEYLCDRWRKRT